MKNLFASLALVALCGLAVQPATGRIAVKVINHLGDEVMKVFLVG